MIAFRDAVPLVRFRAQAMQEAVPVGQGGMAAILGLSDDDVRAACAEAAQGDVVEPVNFNAPAQVVIAGHKAAVERACEAAKAKGAKRALPLPVSAPFHSSLLKPASDRLRDYLANVNFSAPSIPLIRCAGSRRCTGWPQAVLRAWLNAAPARCCPVSSSASTAN